jgi:DNA-binding MarR family transcriptional regulator
MKGTTMSPNPAFTPQLIGQTEKTLNAILDRHLAGAGLTEPQWITLTLALRSAEPVDRAEFAARVSGATKFSEADVEARISDLADAQLLDVTSGTVAVTDAGRELHARIFAANTDLTERLWGDLPAADLETAARVLAIVLERANAEFARV